MASDILNTIRVEGLLAFSAELFEVNLQQRLFKHFAEVRNKLRSLFF